MKQKAGNLSVRKNIPGIVILFGLLLILFEETTATHLISAEKDTAARKADLQLILKALPPDQLNEDKPFDDRGRVSFTDRTFTDWLARTGELPPDFDQMPSIPFLPDPLILDEGGENIPVTTHEQWEKKREWMRNQLQYYITGTRPPKPDNLQVKVLHEKKDGETTLRM